MPGYGATYGTFLYGAQVYGTTATYNSATDGLFRWVIEVDWDGDGVFDGSNEYERFLEIQCSRGRKSWVQPNGSGFYPVSVGACHITLDNYDGRYDAWNTASPLYPNVTYGRDVRIRVIDASTGTIYPVFYGVTSDIVPSGYGANAIVKITIEDGLRYLRNTGYFINTSTGITANTAIGNILDGCYWPARWGRSISTSSATIPYFYSLAGKTPMDQCTLVADTFYGYFFVSQDGKATYTDKTGATVLSTFSQNILLKDMALAQPWINYRNAVLVTSNDFTNSISVASATPVENVLGVKSGILYNADMEIIKPSTYTGDVIFANIVPSLSFFSPSTGALSTDTKTYIIDSNKINATFQYTSTSTGVYFAGSINSNIISAFINVSIRYPPDFSSSSEIRLFVFNTEWLQNSTSVYDASQSFYNLFSIQKKTPIVQFVNRPTYQFLELFNVVTLDIPKLGINSENYRIGGVEHYGTPQNIHTSYYLEPFIST